MRRLTSKHKVLLIFLCFSHLSYSSTANFESSTANFEELCNTLNFKNLTESKKLLSLDIRFHKHKKWTRNLLRAITSKDARDIEQKYKKRFKAQIIGRFDNGLSCSFDSKIRISGDHKDHLDFTPSLDVELSSGNINSVTNFKLFLPHTRGDENELFITSLLRELQFLSPDTYYVNVNLSGRNQTYIFQEKIVKEFLESNQLREGPILEGDERFIFNAGLPFGLSRQSNVNWIKRGSVSLNLAKEATSKLNKGYLEHLLGEQYFSNRNSSFFSARNLSDKIKYRQEAQEFSAIMFALGAAHGLRPHNRKFYYDPMYDSFRPIYYDGHANFLDIAPRNSNNFLNSLESANYDEIVGSFFALNSLKRIDKRSLLTKLNDAGLEFEKEKLNQILDDLIKVLTLISRFSKIEERNGYEQYFATKAELEDKGLKKGMKVVFSTKELLKIEICNFTLSFCSKEDISIEEYASLLGGKYVNPMGKQYIFIGNKEDYLSGKDNNKFFMDHPSYNLGTSSFIIIGDIDFDIDKIKKEALFIQKDSNSRILFTGGSLKDWNIKFIGSSKNLKENSQRFDKNLLTGCLTFLDIALENIDIMIKDSFCEDSINLIRAKGSLNSIEVLNSYSDAIDADFSYLDLNNIYVKGATNDCLDFSSGNYQIHYSELILCGDKAISGGERTTVNILKAYIEESLIGIASKDSSSINIESLDTVRVGTCFSAYNKKQEFWGGKISYGDHNCDEAKFYEQKGSIIKAKNNEL